MKVFDPATRQHLIEKHNWTAIEFGYFDDDDRYLEGAHHQEHHYTDCNHREEES